MNGIPGRSEQQSERSDAGMGIVQKVFGIVKEKVFRREAEGKWESRSDFQGRLSRLFHCLTPAESCRFSPRFLRIDSPRISMRWAL